MQVGNIPITNRKVLEEFQLIVQNSLDIDIPSQDLSTFFRIFHQLHQKRNHPNNRQYAAKEKADLVYKLANKQLKLRESSDYRISILKATHKETKTVTHNVVVIIGDPKSGPNTLVAVHHDTIHAENYQLNVSADKTLKGRTIQDNTVHLAATIFSLSKIEKPEKGAITFLFTDYEEDGCRGSNALKQYFNSIFNKEYKVGLIALESTQGKLGIGHRGKYSTELNSKGGNVGNDFCAFYESLATIQQKAFNNKKISILKQTTGVSTYGEISEDNGLHAKIDFRTNEVVAPDVVHELFVKGLSRNKNISSKDLLKSSLVGLKSGFWSIDIIKDKIIINSINSVSHPSEYNPNEDRTVLPAIYLLLNILESFGYLSEVTKVTWGESTKKNSCPVTGEIVFSSFVTKEHIDSINKSVDFSKAINHVSKDKVIIDKSKTILTGSVITTNGKIINSINKELSDVLNKKIENTTMNYMTDIGGMFNLMKDIYPEVLGFIYGVGEVKNLHKLEELSSSDIITIIRSTRVLPNIVHNQLLKK